MADALCGPSNPLQSFRKQTQIDRTLQQDRLVAAGPRHSPAQGFRSSDPRAGSLDAEFHAFENAPPNPFLFQQQQQPEFAAPIPTFHHAPPPPAAAWAADFQKLSLANTTPILSQQFRTEAPLVRSTNGGGWHDEFIRQRSGAGTPISLGKQAVRDSHVSALTHQTTFGGSYGQPMFQPGMNMYSTPMTMDQQQQQQHSQHFEQQSQLSDAAFEQAFSDAFSQAEQMNQSQSLHQMGHEDVLSLNDQSQQLTDLEKSGIRIGADAINYTEVQDRTMDQDTRDADELARTAGQLLTSVQHDTSTKFQNSQFLDLMRRIRDREIEVQNNDFQNASGQSMSNGTTTAMTSIVDPQRHIQPESHLTPHDPNTFQFPDMNSVYDSENGTFSHIHPQPDYDYNTDGDQYPLTQIQALHPGGRFYPEQSPRMNQVETTMSGAVNGGARISADDFERYDENAVLATKYQKPSVTDELRDGDVGA